MKTFEYIDTNEKLKAFCDLLSSADTCYIDTEFVREKTYYPLLALVQLASEEYQGCIDPLTVDDFSPFIELLVKPDLLKVFHSPSQDLEILFQKFDCIPNPVFDTQLAATVLGFQHQISYAELVRQITGTELEKKYTRADWSRRPLSDGEIDYAMDDVRYLIPVHLDIAKKLEETHREVWIKKDMDVLSSTDYYEIDLDALWRKLKGSQKLKGNQLEIVRQAAIWREKIAQKVNRPRRWIIKDEVLIDIARRKPRNAEDLLSIRDVNEKITDRYGQELIELVKNAEQVPQSEWPVIEKFKPLSDQQVAMGDCLMAICRLVAAENQFAVATLATRKDIDKLILSRNNNPLLQGWRFDMLGSRLLDFLHGQKQLYIENESLELKSRTV